MLSSRLADSVAEFVKIRVVPAIEAVRILTNSATTLCRLAFQATRPDQVAPAEPGGE